MTLRSFALSLVSSAEQTNERTSALAAFSSSPLRLPFAGDHVTQTRGRCRDRVIRVTRFPASLLLALKRAGADVRRGKPRARRTLRSGLLSRLNRFASKRANARLNLLFPLTRSRSPRGVLHLEKTFPRCLPVSTGKDV